ncbi:MAG: transcriptional repressor LexA [Acidobacteriota bacterium]
MTLTDRQREIYDYILAFRREHGCSPSIPELQKAFSIRSPNGVAGHLNALIAKGVLRRSARGSRNIDPTAADSTIHSLPVYGSVAAGMPEFISGSGAESTLRADETTLGFEPKPGCFALKVRGESMKNAGILSGDTVVVEPSAAPRENQVVVALIDGESTLKRLVRLDGRYFLKAENPAFPELHPRADLVIQGVVRAVLRRLE